MALRGEFPFALALSEDVAMESQTAEQLTKKKCVPCEGGVPKYTLEASKAQLEKLNGWRLTHDGQRIRKDWVVKHFMAGLEFFNAVAEVAEDEGHHPDLHLEGYRNLWIEVYTHAIGGLSENDFILAAKIDELPIRVKQ
jgi:4a-hydroxytetrahydrobiopterin dehydratase